MTVAKKKTTKKKLSKTPEAKEKRFQRLKEKRKRQKESKKEEKAQKQSGQDSAVVQKPSSGGDGTAKATTKNSTPRKVSGKFERIYSIEIYNLILIQRAYTKLCHKRFLYFFTLDIGSVL